MSNQELKKQVVEKLRTFEDEIILDEIYRLLQITEVDNETHLFTDAQMKFLDKRDSQIENGIFLTEAEADKEAEEWLKK